MEPAGASASQLAFPAQSTRIVLLARTILLLRSCLRPLFIMDTEHQHTSCQDATYLLQCPLLLPDHWLSKGAAVPVLVPRTLPLATGCGGRESQQARCGDAPTHLALEPGDRTWDVSRTGTSTGTSLHERAYQQG